MKIAKQAFLDLMNKISVKGTNNEAVIEKDGTITKSAENELIIVGTAPAGIFTDRVALSNIGMIAKIVEDSEAADIEMDVQEKKLCIATDVKYAFRLADPATTESLATDRNRILALMEGLNCIKVDGLTVKKIRRVISSMVADRISLFLESGILHAVVAHVGTDSTATIEVCKINEVKDFKIDFRTAIFSKILELTGDAGLTLYAGKNKDTGKDSAAYFELADQKFIYMLSFIEGGN